MMTELVRLSMYNIAHAVGLAQEMHKLSSFAADGPAFDWDYCKHTMHSVMNDPTRYFVLARSDGSYVGAVTGKIITHYFSPEIMGVEEAWYVRADTPGRASIGIKLMRGFVDWCMQEHNALAVQSGDVANIRSIGVDALYRSMGFTRYGVVYRLARAQ